MTAAPGSTLWLLGHDLRLVGRDVRAGGKSRAITVGILLGVTVILIHVVGYTAAPMLAHLRASYPADVLLTGSIALAGAFTLFLSKSISEATDALHQRGDLDLLLSSPLPMRRVLTTRLLAIAVIAGFLPIILILPLVNGMVLRGYFTWAGAYPVLSSLALIAASGGSALTFGLLAWVGPRYTRFAARALATLFGAVSFLFTQAKFLLSDQTRAALWHYAAPIPGHSPLGPQWWPARAALGDPIPMFAVAAGGIACLLMVSRTLGQAYGTGVLNNLALTGKAGTADTLSRRFSSSLFLSLLRKETRLLLRHPGLGPKLFYQFVFLVPGAIALLRLHVGNHHGSVFVVFLAALMTGTITRILIAGPFEGDQASALARTAPIPAGRTLLAKLLAVTTALILVGGLPLTAIWIHLPTLRLAALTACTGAATTRLYFTATSPEKLRRPGLQGRMQVQTDGLLAVLVDIAWGILGMALALAV
jgi:ABC-2 type transport system permease protein